MVPGPGQYTLNNSCNVRESDKVLASYKSVLPRDFIRTNNEVPDAGLYNTKDSFDHTFI